MKNRFNNETAGGDFIILDDIVNEDTITLPEHDWYIPDYLKRYKLDETYYKQIDRKGNEYWVPKSKK